MVVLSGLARGEQNGKFHVAAVRSLVRYGGAYWRDSRKMSDGASQGAHKSSAAKQWAKLGRHDLAKEARPSRPKFPHRFAYLWDIFNDFSFGLKADGMGPVMASWQDAIAFCMATDTALRPWEMRALLKLANARAGALSEKPKEQKSDGVQGKDRPD